MVCIITVTSNITYSVGAVLLQYDLQGNYWSMQVPAAIPPNGLGWNGFWISIGLVVNNGFVFKIVIHNISWRSAPELRERNFLLLIIFGITI